MTLAGIEVAPLVKAKPPRSENCYFSQFVSQIERFSGVASWYTCGTEKLPDVLHKEEALMSLSTAYRSAVNMRRGAGFLGRRGVRADLEDLQEYVMPEKAKEHGHRILGELQVLRDTILGVYDKLIARTPRGQIKTLYQEMKTDYFEYLQDFDFYCYRPDEVSLSAKHLIYLRLALHYSVFQCEMLASPEKAHKTARNINDYTLGAPVAEVFLDDFVLACRLGMGEAT